MSFGAFSQQTEESDVEADSTSVVIEEVKETRYVTDKLRLSLYKAADSASGTIKLLVSGDRLDVLDRSGPYSRVRTAEGLTGWVKNGFLVSTPTASTQLKEMEKKIAGLQSDLGKYSDSQKIVSEYEQIIKQLKEQNKEITGQMENQTQQQHNLEQENQQLTEQIESLTSRGEQLDWYQIKNLIIQLWYFGLGALLLCFLIGYWAGRKIIEAQVNRRFQGVKVI